MLNRDFDPARATPVPLYRLLPSLPPATLITVLRELSGEPFQNTLLRSTLVGHSNSAEDPSLSAVRSKNLHTWIQDRMGIPLATDAAAWTELIAKLDADYFKVLHAISTAQADDSREQQEDILDAMFDLFAS